jgi:hypothetical protein
MRLLLGLCIAALLSAAPPATLQMNRGMIQQYEDGPPVLRPDTVTAGETIHFSFHLQGFTRKEDHVLVSYSAQAFDPHGVPLAPAITAKNESMLTAQDREWQPKLRGNIVLPELLFPGEYKLHIQAEDEIAGTSVMLDLPFLVAGPPVAPTASLEIQGFDYYRDDEAEKPLPVAAYRQGEEIHARFLITGYRHKEDGSIHVSYGIKLVNAAGNVLFDNKEAAQDDTTAFYPKPYIPAQMGFTLKPGTAAGEYTLEVTAHDAVGEQVTSAKRSFRLE